jgi:hypothetical protein
MKYENFDVKVYELQSGVRKLLKYGIPTFEIYADEIDMSFCDRNRVIGKCKISYGKELKEMPCPKQLTGERWNFYTKTMGYTNDKAREIINRVSNEPSGHDITKLAKGVG